MSTKYKRCKEISLRYYKRGKTHKLCRRYGWKQWIVDSWGCYLNYASVMLDKPIQELNLCNKSPRLIMKNSTNSWTVIMWKKMTMDRSCTVATLCTWKSSIGPMKEIRYKSVQKKGGNSYTGRRYFLNYNKTSSRDNL